MLFFALVAILDVSIGDFGNYIQSHAKGGATRTLNDLVKNDVHDILVFGSSRAHSHYDTPFLSDTLGLDVYNAGYDGNGIIFSYGIFELIVERYHPKLIIYDVEPAFDINVYNPDHSNRRYLNMLKPYYKHNSVAGIIKEITLEEWLVVHSGMIRYNSKLLSAILDFYTGNNRFKKGYKPLQGVYAPPSSITKDNRTEYPLANQIDTIKLKYVRSFLSKAQTLNIPIILVASPKFEAKSSSVFKPIKNICSEYNIPFVDCYTDSIISHNNNYFNDPMHMNKNGARMFSKVIVNEMRNQLSK